MIVAALMLLIAATSLVALWHVCCAIARMSPATRGGIRFAFVAKAGGLFILLAAVVDHFFGAPYTWPWLMLVGVALFNAGVALLHVATRRDCRCPECPVRQVVTRKG